MNFVETLEKELRIYYDGFKFTGQVLKKSRLREPIFIFSHCYHLFVDS